jgi:hypothetical protein
MVNSSSTLQIEKLRAAGRNCISKKKGIAKLGDAMRFCCASEAVILSKTVSFSQNYGSNTGLASRSFS